MLYDHDYADFGCSEGGNMDLVRAVLPEQRGIGFDIDAKKLVAARQRGHEVSDHDILHLEARRQFQFVTMSHFLEHLVSPAEVKKFVVKGTQVAHGFVLIRQPYFDADDALLRAGLKAFWSDWHGHRNNTSMLDFWKIGRDLLRGRSIRSFALFGRGRIAASDHNAIIPLEAPMDSLHYDPATMGAKPAVRFDFPCYEEIVMDIVINPNHAKFERKKLLQKLHSRSALELVMKSQDYPDF